MKLTGKRKIRCQRAKPLLQRLFAILVLSAITLEAYAWTCVYVSSYHKGYPWSDGIERGLREELKGHCDLIQFDMDSKRKRDDLYLMSKARKIANKIKKIKPDVLIASDDNAAKYIIVPYFKGGKTPVVFCGINWTIEEYGFPASNVTGMIEIAPVRPMLDWAGRLLPRMKKGLYIGADTLTNSKDLKHVVKVAADMAVVVDSVLVDTLDAWEKAFQQAEDVDFIILGSMSGIAGWDTEQAKDFVKKSAGKLILTNYRWMMPFAMLGFVEIPEEHGRWAAKTAIAIQGGLPIQRIPVIASQKWEVYENPLLLKLAGIDIPEALRSRAKKFVEKEKNASR